MIPGKEQFRNYIMPCGRTDRVWTLYNPHWKKTASRTDIIPCGRTDGLVFM